MGLSAGLVISTVVLSASIDHLLLPETKRASEDLINDNERQLLSVLDQINTEVQKYTTQKFFQDYVETNDKKNIFKSIIKINTDLFPIPAQLVQLQSTNTKINRKKLYLFQRTKKNIQHMKNIDLQLNKNQYQIINSIIDTEETGLAVFSGKVSSHTDFNEIATLRVVFSLERNSPLLGSLYQRSNANCIMLAIDGKLFANASAGSDACIDRLTNSVNKSSDGLNLSIPSLTFSSKDNFLMVAKKITKNSALGNIHLLVAKKTSIFTLQKQLLWKIITAVACSLVLSALLASFISKRFIKNAVEDLILHVKRGPQIDKAYKTNNSNTKKKLMIDEFVTITKAYDEIRNELFEEASERAKAETDKSHLRKELSTIQTKKMESLGTLTAGVAHDFNNILTIIQNNLELVEISLYDSDILIGSHDSILKACKRATSLVSDLMLYVRDDKGLHKSNSLTKVIEDIAIMIPQLIKDRSIKFDYQIENNKTFNVISNKDKLFIALLNIISNAKDAMPYGGRISISLRSLSNIEATSIFQVSSHNTYCLLEILDTGNGVKKELHEKVFEPFFTTKELGKGTGMGLSIVYECVKSSRGKIKVTSNPKGGANFQILFPVATDKKQPKDT